jgi:hypothetical protein
MSKGTEELIIHLFEVKDGELEPTRHCHALKFLKDIMDAYPDNHLDIYKYLYYMACPDPVHNPYFNENEIIKEEKIIRDNNLRFSTEDDLVVIALDKCTRLYKTPTVKAQDTIKKMIENVMDWMATTKVESSSANQLIKAGKDFKELKEEYLVATKELHEEQKAAGKRGGGQLAYDLEEGNTRDDD